jgi:hypothetical protein
MARGFDSKSVEEQQAEYLAKRSRRVKEAVSAEEAARQRERESLELSLRNVVSQLAAASGRRREMLEQARVELEKRMEGLKSQG